jgi:hypothetical protein
MFNLACDYLGRTRARLPWCPEEAGSHEKPLSAREALHETSQKIGGGSLSGLKTAVVSSVTHEVNANLKVDVTLEVGRPPN